MIRTTKCLGWMLPLLLIASPEAIAQYQPPPPYPAPPPSTGLMYRPQIDRNPFQLELYRKLGEALLERGQPPNDEISYYGIGLALENQNRREEAIAAYRQAIAANPYFALAYHSLGKALMQSPRETNLSEEVISALQKAVELAPNHPPFFDDLSNAARVLREFGLYQKASNIFQFLLKVRPNDGQISIDYGLTLWYDKQFESAERVLQNAIAQNPKNPEALTILGNILAQQQRWEDAFASYQQAIELEGEQVASSFALDGITDVLRQQNKLEEAIALYRQLIQRYPNQSVLREKLQALLQEQELKRDVVSSKPQLAPVLNNPEELFRHASDLRNQNKLDEAIKIYQQIITQNPTLSGGYSELGDTLKLQSRWDEAIASYQQALELSEEDYSKAFLHNDIGLILQEQGKLQEAVIQSRQAIRLLPNYDEAQENLQEFERQLNSRPK